MAADHTLGLVSSLFLNSLAASVIGILEYLEGRREGGKGTVVCDSYIILNLLGRDEIMYSGREIEL